MEIKIKVAKKSDAYMLAKNMRDEDAFEAKALFGMSPIDAAKYSLKHSHRAFTVYADGKIACCFGINPASALTDYGIIWMLSTKIVDSHPYHVVKYLQPEISKLCEGYELVYNFVADRNKGMIKFLEQLGFTLEEPEKSGVYANPFRKFYKVVECVSGQ